MARRARRGVGRVRAIQRRSRLPGAALVMLAELERTRLGTPPAYDLYHLVGYGVPASELVVRGILPWWSTPTLQLHALREGLVAAGSARRLVFLAASDPFIWMYGPDIARAAGIAGERCWILLSAANGTHNIVRTGPERLTLSEQGCGICVCPLGRIASGKDGVPDCRWITSTGSQGSCANNE
jgi:hypothetical protein